jgi:hypothetical protein
LLVNIVALAIGLTGLVKAFGWLEIADLL